MNKNKRSTSIKRPPVILGLIAVILIIALIIVFNHEHRFIGSNNKTVEQPISQQSNSNNATGTNVKQPTSNNGINQGSATDNHGRLTTPVASSQNQWSISQSGAIILKAPISNEVIKPGASIEGTSTLSQIQYTLIDSKVGVISQGSVSVVSGTFSASMNFQSTASSGRLDVYSVQSNGKEINLIEIPVNF